MDRHEHILVSTINAFEWSWEAPVQALGTPEEASGLLGGGSGSLWNPEMCWEGARGVLGRILKAFGTFQGRFKVHFGAPRGVSWLLLMVPVQA